MTAADAKKIALKARKEKMEAEIADVLGAIEQEAEDSMFYINVRTEALTTDGAEYLRTLGYVVVQDEDGDLWTISWNLTKEHVNANGSY